MRRIVSPRAHRLNRFAPPELQRGSVRLKGEWNVACWSSLPLRFSTQLSQFMTFRTTWRNIVAITSGRNPCRWLGEPFHASHYLAFPLDMGDAVVMLWNVRHS